MLPEPLTAQVTRAGDYGLTVTATAGDGTPVARVVCAINVRAGCGVFGEAEMLTGEATPRQALRAFVLLIREALRIGAELGVTRVAAETPPRLEELITRITGAESSPHGGRRRFNAELQAVRTRVLAETASDGDVRGDVPGTRPSETASVR